MNIKQRISASIAVGMAAVLAMLGFTVLVPSLANAQTVQATVQTAPVTGTVNVNDQGGHNWGGSGEMGGQGGMYGGMHGGMSGMKPGVFGTVSAVNGTTLTVSGKQGFGPNATTTATYTVDASNATVKKNNATSTVSSIAVGDTVMVAGTVSGTNVTATMIRDGVVPMHMGGPGGMNMGPGGMGRMGSSTRSMPASPITGNGEPVIAGSVTAVNGSTLTVTNKSSVTYTVDTTNAKIVQGQSTIAIAGVAVGDNVIVQGTVNGTSVAASSVIDQKAPAAGTAGAGGSTGGQPQSRPGIFGAIGNFFSHLFGF